MNYPPEPRPGFMPIVCNTRPKSKIVRVEYSAATKANCGLAWRVFADCGRWHRFSDAYRSIQWRGEPWAPGSRLQIEIVHPVVATQDRVITICTPPRCVAWINHVMGYTMEQWILFDPDIAGGTRISTWIEISGADLELPNVERIVTKFAEDWFAKFCEECNRMVDGR